MAANLGRRVATAAVAIPIALGVVYLGGWPLVALLAAVGVLGVRELQAFAARQAVRPSALFGLGTAAALPVVTWLALEHPSVAAGLATWWPFLAAGWLLALLTWLLLARKPEQRPFAAAAITLFAVLYAAALPTFLLDIRHADLGLMSWRGTALVAFPLVVTWVCDSFAMFGGMLIGGPKLAPRISPGKTQSGALAGVVGALLVGLLFAAWLFPAAGVRAGLLDVLLVAGALSLVGQVGDLAESLLKRDVGIKDSGTIIPGHGGVLDRFDSLYFVVPVAAALYRCLGIG